jgi:hypothetical protein
MKRAGMAMMLAAMAGVAAFDRGHHSVCASKLDSGTCRCGECNRCQTALQRAIAKRERKRIPVPIDSNSSNSVEPR